MQTLYRVEAPNSEDYGFPVPLPEALQQVKQRAPHEKQGALRILRVDYQLDPEAPPGIHTKAAARIWRATILRFPDIGSLGVYVCKPDSQHRYGNADDWAAPPTANTSDKVIGYLDTVAHWQVNQAIRGTLPITQLIWRFRIWTPEQGWHPYTGIPHYAHIHDSGPLINTSLPCGEV